MQRITKFGAVTASAVALAALVTGCGTQQTNLTSKFMTVDSSTNTVTLNLIAAYTDANNYENFDGYANGAMTVTIPTGDTVKIKYYNNFGIPVDLGVYTPGKHLAFKGAGDSISEMFSNPASGIEPGQAMTVSFVASKAGTYQIANYVDRFEQLGNNANQDLGMWDVLKVVNGATPSITAT